MNASTRPTHTPGPWSVEGSYVHGPDGKRFLAVASDGEGQANARLISSAPELLTALEKALESIEGQAELLRHCGAAYGIGATLAQARAAIAKATGGNAS